MKTIKQCHLALTLVLKLACAIISKILNIELFALRISNGLKVALCFFLVIMMLTFSSAQEIKPEHKQDATPVHQYICYEAYDLLPVGQLRSELSLYLGEVRAYDWDVPTDIICGEPKEEDAQGSSVCEGTHDADQWGASGTCPLNTPEAPSENDEITYFGHFWNPDANSIGADAGLWYTDPTHLIYDDYYVSAMYKARLFWQKAIDSYNPGSPETAYYWLGHVSHLLADMSVPAHVNQDIHVEYGHFEIAGDDSYEEFMAGKTYHTDGNYNIWSRENISAGPINYHSLSLPGEYQDLSMGWRDDEQNLLKLFYNLAEMTDAFDSDDDQTSSNTGAVAGEADEGQRNMRSFILSALISDPDSVAVFISLDGLNFQQIFDSYSFSADRGRVMIADDFENNYPGFDKIYVTYDDHTVPEQFLIASPEREDIGDQECMAIGDVLMPAAIRYVAGLYQLWWNVVNPLNRGDVSGDGNITAYDASLVLQYVVGLMELSPDEQAAADVTGNGTISALDAALILQYTVGLITQFPLQQEAPILTVKDEKQILTPIIAEFEHVSFTTEQKHVVEQLKRLLLEHSLPKQTALLQNYPNPFNPETWMPFKLAQDAPVIISIYDTTGQLIRTIALGHQNAGIYTTKAQAAYWDGRDRLGEQVSSGVYFYTLQAGNFKATRRMVILK